MKIKNQRIELLVFALGISVLFFCLRGILFRADHTLVHDNLYWNFPIFHFFATQLMQGQLPLWDLYSSGGQPFYPNLLQMRLLEPVAILVVLFGKSFTQDTTLLFHWTRILESLVMVTGAYLVLRRFSLNTLVRVALIPLLLFSSFFLGSFHQDGILSQFLWAPWVLFFLLRLVFDQDPRWGNWVGLGFCLGINFQSYFFVGSSLLFVFFWVAVALFYREDAREFFRQKQLIPKVLLFSFVVLGMLAPNLALMAESKDFIFPARMFPADYKARLLTEKGLLPAEPDKTFVEQGIRMPYDTIPFTGAFVKIWEILQIAVPDGNPNIHSLRSDNIFGSPSEAYIYLGLIPWLVALFGFFFGSHPLKRLMLFLTLGFGLMMMGPPGGLHRILYPVMPFLWFVRHTTLLVLFFVFGLFSFFMMGFDALLERRVPRPQWQLPKILTTGFLVALTSFFWIFASRLEYPVFKFPETNFLFIFFLAVALLFWRLRDLLGKEGMLVTLFLSQLIAVGFLHPHPGFFLAYLSPLVLVLFLYRKGLTQLALGAAVIVTLFDLGYSFHQGGRLYDWQETPERAFGVPMEPQTPALLARKVYPSTPENFAGHQAPRYLPVLYQEPYALNGVILFKGEKASDRPGTFQHGLESPRWNSFVQSRRYFDLLHSRATADSLERIFEVGKFPIQFKQGGVLASNRLSVATLPADFFDQMVLLEKNGFGVSGRESSFQAERESFRVLSYTGNQLRLQVQLRTPRILYWADGYSRWWNVDVDGKSGEVLVANGNFKAVSLGAGSHEVFFSFRPKWFLWGLGFFYLSPVGAAAFATVMSLWLTAKEKKSKWSYEPGGVPA